MARFLRWGQAVEVRGQSRRIVYRFRPESPGAIQDGSLRPKHTSTGRDSHDIMSRRNGTRDTHSIFVSLTTSTFVKFVTAPTPALPNMGARTGDFAAAGVDEEDIGPRISVERVCKGKCS